MIVTHVQGLTPYPQVGRFFLPYNQGDIPYNQGDIPTPTCPDMT